MDYQPIPRPPDAFQQPVTPDEIAAICRRVFGRDTQVAAAVELGGGMYNTTLRVHINREGQPVILRVAPSPHKQFRSEHALMRNEFATMPYLAPIAPLMPRLIAADFTHEVIGRDVMVQTLLGGIPAAERLGDYPRSTWPGFFRQLGEVARTVHAVRGPHFGPVASPGHTTWSEALTASFTDIAADVDAAGLDATDLHKVADLVGQHRAAFDEITKPRLLSGDLWTVNCLLDVSAPVPTLSGVIDFDRTLWGDPAADWTIRMATANADERQSFWETYGPLDQSDAAAWRSKIYEVRHLGAIRLERHRLGNREGVKNSYEAIAALLAAVG
ncbi:aminoglycoside phosphotransferase family protein [Streptomyces kronopolitis]|uniref:phosphotransferase family protein n=1 Tax=Streptomyces kronopolitis TaxID=1612435 RepID=UPI00342BAD5D